MNTAMYERFAGKPMLKKERAALRHVDALGVVHDASDVRWIRCAPGGVSLADAGTPARPGPPVTCLRCLGTTDEQFARDRQVAKELTFAQAYGATFDSLKRIVKRGLGGGP